MHSIRYSLALTLLSILLTACGGGGGGGSENDSDSNPTSSNSTDLGESINPTEPTDSNNTVDPIEPTTPNDPAEPVEPIVPIITIEPVEPTTPNNTTDPIEPTTPDSTIDPIEPTVEPTEPDSSTDPIEPADTTKQVYGSAVKGPVTSAIVNAYTLDFTKADLKGTLIATGHTNANAQITDLRIDENASTLFILEFTGGLDITTNHTPLIPTLRTIITKQQLIAGTPIFATPLTTFTLELAAELAAKQASANDKDFLEALADATIITKNSFGMGEYEGLLTNTNLFTTSPILSAGTDQKESTKHRFAIEAFSALTLEVFSEVNAASSTATTNEILSALAMDIADGDIDGLKDGDAIIDTFKSLGSSTTAISANLLGTLTQDPNNLNIPGTNTPISHMVSTVLPTELETLGLNINISNNITPTLLPAMPGTDTDGDRIVDALDPDNSTDPINPADPNSPIDPTDTVDPIDPIDTTKQVNGSAVKGPVTSATVKAYILDFTKPDLKGALVATGSTNANAQITDLRIDENASTLFILEFTDGLDITTNRAPLIPTLRTMITQQQLIAGTPVFATPLTTFALELATKLPASHSNEDFLAAVTDATVITKNSFGMGEYAGLLTNTNLFTTSPILSTTTNQAESNNYRVAIETFAALALEIHTTVIDSGITATANQVLAALATDIADGTINALDSNNTTISIFSKLSTNLPTRGTILLDILTQDPNNLNIPGTNTPITKLISDVLPQELQQLDLNISISSHTIPDLLPAVPGDDIDGDRIVDAADSHPEDPNNLTRGLSISWTAPETRENGDPLSSDEIGGYEIYYYSSEATLADANSIHVTGNNTNYNIEPGTLSPGTYMFAIATFDKDNLFSDTTPPVEVVIN